jgi:hypothetical protein
VTTKVLRTFPGEDLKIDGKGTVVDVELPAGYRRVWKGIARAGDMHLHAQLFQDDGIVSWCDAEINGNDDEDNVETFSCLIRPDAHLGAGPDKPCDGCGLRAREDDCRFCWRCISLGMHKRKPGVTI